MAKNDKHARLKGFASDIIEVDGRLVRPGDVLLDNAFKSGGTEALRSVGGEPYVRDPEKSRTDWRQRPGAPDYRDLNQRLAPANVELWTVPRVGDQLELIEGKQVPGLHHNHVFMGEDFYHGGPGGPPVAIAPPDPELLRTVTGDRIADIAVLDNGLPEGWNKWHGELQLVVDRHGQANLPNDPMDEYGPNGKPDGVLDQQAGHGLFICGLIARVAPGLDIQLHRVLHASGEGEESLITATLHSLIDTPIKVINLSLGTFVPNDKTSPKLADTILSLLKAGKVVVAASGNAGGTKFGKKTLFPGSLKEVIAVGAYDSRNGNHTLWPKSCPADIYAPGVELVGSHVVWKGKIDWEETHGADQYLNGWATWSGTSFAAPLVAAQLAIMLAETDPPSAADLAWDWVRKQEKSNWPAKNSGEIARYFEVKGLTDWS